MEDGQTKVETCGRAFIYTGLISRMKQHLRSVTCKSCAWVHLGGSANYAMGLEQNDVREVVGRYYAVPLHRFFNEVDESTFMLEATSEGDFIKIMGGTSLD